MVEQRIGPNVCISLMTDGDKIFDAEFLHHILRARISVESLLKVYDVVKEVPLILMVFFFFFFSQDAKICSTVVLPNLMPACSFGSNASEVVLMRLYATFSVTLPGFADKVYGLCSL